MTRKQLPTDLPTINVPFGTAKTRYGKQVADLMARKAVSVAESAKKMAAEDFRWTVEYIQAPDPETDDPDQFVRELAGRSEVYLVARGGHWKGWEQLPDIPPAVMARFQERARLVCSVRTEPEGDDSETEQNGIVAALDAWLAAHPQADRRMAAVARVALESLAETGE